jgi:aminoglycoside phosphotransferase (APT) family kinase protein
MADEATEQDGTVAAPDGIDPEALGAWFGAHVPGADLPLRFERIAGGHSNLTYRVTDAADRQWALRRPPLGKRLGSAHDMGREFKVVSALGKTEVPVAPVVGLCEDESVNGAPFYVMEFVEGPVLRGLAEAEIFPDEGDRRAIGERVADTLVQIHAVDPDAAGLGDLGRKEDYVARQLHRWQGQWEKSKTRELEAIDRVHAALSARIPEQGPATIVHGDYRLDNMILSESGEVAAVVDWELCTLGDPLADVGLLMAYWPERGDDVVALGMPANLAPGFPTQAEVAARYAERSGRDLSDLGFYVALGYWKLAIILEGVYARYVAGGYGKVDEGVHAFAKLVERLAEEAERVEKDGISP